MTPVTTVPCAAAPIDTAASNVTAKIRAAILITAIFSVLHLLADSCRWGRGLQSGESAVMQGILFI